MPDRILIRKPDDALGGITAKTGTAAYVLYYHFVFRPKWNRPAFTEDAPAAAMVDAITRTCEEHDYLVFGVSVLPDHVHAVLSLPPDVAPATAARYVKGASARRFNAACGLAGSLWSDGYAVEAVGKKIVYQVLSYLANQDEHHGVNPGSSRGSMPSAY